MQCNADIKTFAAEVTFLDIYKGKNLIRNLTERYHLEALGLYNVSNFGDEVMCYSNVKEGESYILFMTNFEGALSAKYDDIFGAAADYNVKNEAQVLQALGELFDRFHRPHRKSLRFSVLQGLIIFCTVL